MIKIEGLSKFFRTEEVETIALNGVSMEVKDGEFVAIMGPSGCGKSTLLNILGLLDNPTSGNYYLADREVGHLKEKERTQVRKGNIGFVFQSFNLIDELNVFENVELPLTYLKVKASERKQMVNDILKRMNISHRANHFPQQLSGGQQQRVAIARALVNEPKVLLLDEPLGALDAKLRKDMQTELKKIQKEVGITFIFVTHDQEEALSMSDTIVVLNDGVIQQIGTPMDIYNEPQNRFVAEFIGESNIIEGNMIKDCLVNFDGRDWECVDKGFKDNEDIEVVLRPEDMDVVEPEAGKVSGTIISKVFMGVHYEYLVETKNRNYKVHTTENYEIGKKVGLTIDPFDIQVMHKMEN